MSLVLETVATNKVPMPGTATAFQMNVVEFNEGNEEDFSAVLSEWKLAQLETSDAGSLGCSRFRV